MHLHDSELQHWQDVESGWFSSNVVTLACTVILPYVLTSRFNSFGKLAVLDPKLVLKTPLVQSLLNSNIFSQTINPNLASLAQRYTTHINFLSLKQEVILETSSNTCKGKQAKLALDLHSLISIDTKHRVQKHNKTN